MKKILSILLVLSLMLCNCAALAEEVDETEAVETEAVATEAPEQQRDTLVVGSTTELNGNFFSEMFGNNTADLDVRMLLHDYRLMQWQNELGSYGINKSVLSGAIALDNPDGTRTYIVTIYSDLKYSDGTPITAADYAFGMLLSMAPEMREIGAQTVYSDYVVGSDEYAEGKTNVLTGMRLLNETMLSIQTKEIYQPFFYELGLLDYTPFPIHVIAPGCEVVDEGYGVTIQNIDKTIEEPLFTAELLRETILDPETGYMTHPSVVSGSYVLDSYDEEEHVATFSMNPYYKGDFLGRTPMIPKLVYKHVMPETMIDALASGEVDLLNKCTAATVIDAGKELVASGNFVGDDYPRSGYSFISFSCERPVVNSDIVRKAIAHCLDKETMVKSYIKDYGLAIDGYYGIGQWIYPLAIGAQEPPVPDLPDDATAEEKKTYDDTIEDWKALNLDGLKIYEFNVEKAVKLLEEDGWTLNRSGEPFNPQVDDVRCKNVDGELLALDLKMIYPVDNAIGDVLEETFLSNLRQAGIVVTVEAKTMSDLLDVYYRKVEREYDLMYLATNFATVFDPSYTFAPEDAYQGVSNRSGIDDEELYQRTVDMRLTEPGDTLTYLKKWIAFEERWTEVLPTIPVYSNVYHDFHVNWLQDYKIATGLTWAEAIIGAYLGDPMPVDETLEAQEPMVEE